MLSRHGLAPAIQAHSDRCNASAIRRNWARRIRALFLWQYHGKFAADRVFGTLRNKMKNSNVFCGDDIGRLCEELKNANGQKFSEAYLLLCLKDDMGYHSETTVLHPHPACTMRTQISISSVRVQLQTK